LTDSALQAERARTSWVESANDPACGFPLQSLPYCLFASAATAHIGIGIGSRILDLHQCASLAAFETLPPSILQACKAAFLNSLIACGSAAHAQLRDRLLQLLDNSAPDETSEQLRPALLPMDSVKLLKPIEPANYTDFYASIHHATRVGRLFRPDQPLLPNYKYVPIGYHGRASSIVISGTPIHRPSGQLKPVEPETVPTFAPSRFLDYELELAIYIADPNPLGDPISIDRAASHIFGVSLLNDWSARDIQAWEYQPLGPFVAKSFATSVSPWVVPMAALGPFRCAPIRPLADPPPLPYLFNAEDQQSGAIDLIVEAHLLTSSMRDAHLPPHRLSRANLRDLYWTPAQLVAHHTSNGCNLLPGDLLATGTISGAEDDSAGCLLELTTGGRNPLVLPNGETRRALEDGDEVSLRGVCRRDGFPAVSLGECRGTVLPAHLADLNS
jgi:fumarylacetoacetase